MLAAYYLFIGHHKAFLNALFCMNTVYSTATSLQFSINNLPIAAYRA